MAADGGVIAGGVVAAPSAGGGWWDAVPHTLQHIAVIGGPILVILVLVLVLIGIWLWKVAPEREKRRAEELALKNKLAPPAAAPLLQASSSRLEEIRTAVDKLSTEISLLKTEVVYPADCEECKQNMEREMTRVSTVLQDSVSRMDEGLTYLRSRLDALNDHLLSIRK